LQLIDHFHVNLFILEHYENELEVNSKDGLYLLLKIHDDENYQWLDFIIMVFDEEVDYLFD